MCPRSRHMDTETAVSQPGSGCCYLSVTSWTRADATPGMDGEKDNTHTYTHKYSNTHRNRHVRRRQDSGQSQTHFSLTHIYCLLYDLLSTAACNQATRKRSNRSSRFCEITLNHSVARDNLSATEENNMNTKTRWFLLW